MTIHPSLPPKVKMGMSEGELEAAKPNVIRNVFGSIGTRKSGKVEFLELIEGQGIATVFIYRFRDGKLGAVVQAVETRFLPLEHTRSLVEKLAEEIRVEHVPKTADQNIRTTGSESAVVTAQLWQNTRADLLLYFVATNYEVSVITFDPKAWGKNDFFSGPESLESMEINVERSKRKLGKTADRSVPMADLLGTKTAVRVDVAPHGFAEGKLETVDVDSELGTNLNAPQVGPSSSRETSLLPWMIAGLTVSLVVLSIILLKRAK